MATVDGVATEHGAASPTAPTPPTQQSPPPRSPPGLSPPPLDHAATADSIEHALLVHPADSFPDLVHLRVEDSQEGDDGDVVARLHKTVEEMTAFLDAPTLPVAPDATGGGDADVGDLVRAAVLDFLVPAAPSIRQDNDMEILAGELLRHPAVDADVEAALRCLVGLFKETPLRALPLSQKDADTVYVVLSLIYHLGQISSNVYRRFADLDAVELIRPVIVGCQGLRMHAPAVRLLFEVCQTQELSLSDLSEWLSPYNVRISAAS
ncbi:hypothetical protein HK405_004138 [Cladochytrium tenue]|nr:hypothetical protein HK405_004138 [Cladochytrium tenue]